MSLHLLQSRRKLKGLEALNYGTSELGEAGFWYDTVSCALSDLRGGAYRASQSWLMPADVLRRLECLLREVCFSPVGRACSPAFWRR